MSDPESSTPEGVKLKSESGGVEESDKPNDTADYISVISDAQLSVSEPSCISNGTPPEWNDIRADDIRVLKQELETFRKRADQTPPGGDVLKKQYEAKLKDVMEKAREHARKIASERDELKKQVEEKDLKITNFKQVMTSATAEIGSKDIRIAELEDQSRSSSSRAAKLEEQMAAMEAHYTKAPSGKQTATLSVRDSSGTEWILLTDRWWKRMSLGDDLSVQTRLDVDQLRTHEREIESMQKQLEKAHSEFQEYKRKVDVVLQGRSVTSTPVESDDGLRSAKKIMKLEAEAAINAKTISELKSEVANLQHSERGLAAQLATTKQEIARLVEPVDALEQQITTLRGDKKILSDKLHQARDQVAVLSRELEDARIASLVLSEQRIESLPDLAGTHAGLSTRTPSESAWTQTDMAPSILLRHSPDPTPVSPQPPQSRPELVNSQHDSVAIPLRQQIRQLILELESEKHEHSMTIEQLHVVKEELRKMEAEKKLGADLTDAVKVEYMRNVARKFIALAPPSDDEFEQLVPVILTFFGLEGQEAAALMKERRKRIDDQSKIHFPKLW